MQTVVIILKKNLPKTDFQFRRNGMKLDVPITQLFELFAISFQPYMDDWQSTHVLPKNIQPRYSYGFLMMIFGEV